MDTTIPIILALTELGKLKAWDYALSGGMFVETVLLINALFNQPGKPKLSPQREAAIATGHTDRKTVFERGGLRSLMMLLLAISHSINLPKAKAWIHRTLIASGNEKLYTAQEYLALSMLTGVVAGGILTVLNWVVYRSLSVLALVFGLAMGMFLTLYQLHSETSKRVQQISRRLPYTLDLIALAMGAGATFTEAVHTIVREDPDDPFNVELRSLLSEMELGTTRRQALINLAQRVPLPALQSIVASVIQAEALGTPLGHVLHEQSTLLRLHRTVRAENLAASASVRILMPCLLLLMAIILLIFGPAIVRTVRGGLF